MRVVHVSTFDLQGGAARAAWRLHSGMQRLGVESSMLVRFKSAELSSVQQVVRKKTWRTRVWKLIQEEYCLSNRTPLSNTHFSLGEPGMDLSAKELAREADILQLHWVQEFQSPASLAALLRLGKPLVWTLHDQRAFTGGCHYSAGCRGFERECADCPQLKSNPLQLPKRSLRDQREAFPSGAVTVVTPSRWLAEEARRSALFREARIEVIPNGIETEIFRPMPRAEARLQLGLPEQGFLALCGADSGEERRKGAAELLAALERLPENAGVQALWYGGLLPGAERLGSKVRSLGYLGPAELRAAYCAADVFVLPSLEDNLPNTALESLACGTPIVAFETGGIPELVINGKTGWLVPPGDIQALTDSLASLARDPRLCRPYGAYGAQWIAERYSIEMQARRYLELYSTLSPPRTGSRFGGSRHLRRSFLPAWLYSAYLKRKRRAQAERSLPTPL
jgi:glycosyltransferase involved in cell wall biosynthesis